jgi:hypothetical protein
MRQAFASCCSTACLLRPSRSILMTPETNSDGCRSRRDLELRRELGRVARKSSGVAGTSSARTSCGSASGTDRWRSSDVLPNRTQPSATFSRTRTRHARQRAGEHLDRERFAQIAATRRRRLRARVLLAPRRSRLSRCARKSFAGRTRLSTRSAAIRYWFTSQRSRSEKSVSRRFCTSTQALDLFAVRRRSAARGTRSVGALPRSRSGTCPSLRRRPGSAAP